MDSNDAPNVPPRDVARAVVVITGASSGIGRATALEFARRGSRLALAARAKGPLHRVAAECVALGAEAIAVPTDVRSEPEVEALARETVARFDRLDVWVNNAGVIAYGRFEDTPSEIFRAVLDTNLMGQVHSVRAALPVFRCQGSGLFIHVSSVWGCVTAPEVSAYVTSKFAVRAFSECLRQELRGTPGIEVATILPQAVDTPIFERAANYAGKAARPIPPLLDPEKVARGIVRCAESPQHEITYGAAGRMLEIVHMLAPRLYSRILPPGFEAGNYRRERTPASDGAVLSVPREGQDAQHRVRGGWKERRRRELLRAFLAASGGMLKGFFGRG